MNFDHIDFTVITNRIEFLGVFWMPSLFDDTFLADKFSTKSTELFSFDDIRAALANMLVVDVP